MGSIRRIKTKRRTRDLDQVKKDLNTPKHLAQYKATKAAEDLPGLGRFYCTECAKWFEGEHNLVEHRRGKNHKRRVRELRAQPHSQELAEAVIGLRTDNGLRGKDELIKKMDDLMT
ncbi:putative c2h2 finger domain-containing protein [Phaeomoniella chlamydospora]|uniref:Putative c2h2 finger domain-containing protein n=1 Tax=Phaeomoniella chlamydospora TaxID=158046 RepID=A0A0G2EQM3_PHACM|nr:putative c2h2 finger domain-containing protein [Phaeomoniella chlamydospora]